ncbi:MAG TPA: hypothetical protein VL547_07695 [Dinghuibacter sp.]|uniref:hypothetical protein n=1 Tax=Dinghuibacter sp. TaxID=2024697 RepID=UPI002CC9EE06|nr:hypothetical protein [Dinghuibacter sp.]HTJ11891.1 hypothetical protein [Dinghuibacter sp.]
MKKLLHVSLVAIVVALVGISGCSKGSKGDTGAQGPAGPDSVYHSPWAQLSATGTIVGSDSLYYEDFSASVITQRILDSGIVMGFVGLVNGSTVTDIASASDEGLTTDAFVGGVEVDANYNFTTNAAFPFVYRYVVIPGSALVTDGAFQGLSKETIKKMNYADLNKLLGNTLSIQTN